MKFVELKKRVSQRREACYLLSGDDAFIAMSAVRFFEQMCELPEMNEVRLVAPTASDIVAAALVFPVMSPLRLVIVENFDKDASDLKKYLDSPAPDSVIVIVCGSVPTKNLSGIIDKMEIVECSRQDENVLISYIARECNNGGVNITASAAQLLIASCNRFMTRISVELNKLISFKSGGTITEEDVRALVNADLEYKVYDLTESLASKNGEKAMAILNDIIGSGAAGVFGMIYSHFRKLLYTAITSDDDELKRCLGIKKDFALKMLKSQVKEYSPKRLKKICDELNRVDNDYKVGLIGDKLAIETFAMRILNEGK